MAWEMKKKSKIMGNCDRKGLVGKNQNYLWKTEVQITGKNMIISINN